MIITGSKIILLTALAQLALAANALWGSANALIRWERWGFPREAAAGMFLAGALMLLWRRDATMFVIATLPYILFVLTTVLISVENPAQVPYSAIIIYTYSIIQMYVLYLGECIN